jgi:hypothetical protein
MRDLLLFTCDYHKCKKVKSGPVIKKKKVCGRLHMNHFTLFFRNSLTKSLNSPDHSPCSTLNLRRQCRYNSFYCTLKILCFFYKLKVCGYPASIKSIVAIFPTASDHCISMSHFGNLQYFKFCHDYYVSFGAL